MHLTFVSMARQGRHTWKDYLFGLLTIFGTFLGIGIPVVLGAALILGIPLAEKGEFESQLHSRPYLSLLFAGLLCAVFLFGLYLAVHRVHHRSFLTLISPNASINWSYFAKGFCIWLGVSIVNFLVWYFVNPSRYTLIFNASHWLPFAGLALIITPITTLVMGCFLFAYLLQAVGLLVRRPVVILIVWSFILATLLITPRPPEYWIDNVIRTMFLGWIILKDDRLERVLGILTANSLLSLLLIRFPDSRTVSPAIFSVITWAPLLPTLISSGLKAGIFYYICFGRQSIQAK